METPLAAGWSTHNTFDGNVPLCWLRTVPEPSLFTPHGPFSASRASWEEQPGPPVSHMTKGSVAGLLRLSNIQKKYLMSVNSASPKLDQ